MFMLRRTIEELIKLGKFPASQDVNLDTIKAQEALLKEIASPVSDKEAEALVQLFGPDDYFGLAWTMLHLIETAPSWPNEDCLKGVSVEWAKRMRNRARR